ncbi:MAG TPA: fibronectin type III domain-containing protein [Chryseosolibacter sp.]
MDFKGTVAAGSIFLSWNDVSGMETGYEIWRRKAGTPDFIFVTRTGEDAVSFHDKGLDPQSIYEYKFRAVNNSGRSNYLPSDDLAVNYTFTTSADNHFPPPPQDLKVVANTLNTITLSWKPARDESSVKEYYIYYNNDSIGTGSNSTTDTLTGLPKNTVYSVTVKAVDFGNHFSQPSNQIIATTYLSGLLYKHSTGAWESLDDSAMVATWNSPEFTGTVPNFTLQPRTQEDYFNFQFTGYLNIETEGTYYFDVTSSDGSRLILDGNVIVNNDGLHGTRTVASEAVFLTAGPHAIEVQYFDDTGGHTLTVRYRGPGVGDGTNFIVIPDAALRSGTYIPPAPPPPPSAVVANGVDMRRIDVTWQFADDDQTDYEVYRALTSSGPFEMAIRATGISASDSVGLLPGTQYYYKVKTVNSNGSSAYSNIASATTIVDSEPPTVPEALVLISKTMTHIAFSWNASTDNIGVTHYEIYSGDELIGTSTIHAFTADDLTINTGYQFTVKAVDASGNKSVSSTALAVVTNTSAIFYSLAAGDLNALATWRRNANGTGEPPVSFSDNGQYFIISNRASASLGGPWTIGGSSSRVIVPTGVTLTADHSFSANVELQGDAVLSLNDAMAPDLVKLSPQSTVIFDAYPRIPANSYGNIILSGSAPKTFDADTITVLGNLTLNDGIALKGFSHNSSYIHLFGTLSLLGNRPATAADNTVDLALAGPTPTSIHTDSDVYLFRISTVENQMVNIIHPSGTAVKINLGSLNGGGLVIEDGSSVNINNHDLVLGDASVVNPDQQTGTLLTNGGNLLLASTSAKNSNLYFDATNHSVNRLTVDMTGAGSVSVRSPLEIAEGIKIRKGTLVSGENITLLATAERTAAIYEIENAGAITGEVTVQQHLHAKGTVNGYLSAPVNNVTVSEWQQSFPITGSFSGASGGAGTAPSLFYYRDNNGGWIAYPPTGGANTAPIEKGVGYAALLHNDINPITLAVKGNPYQGSIQYTLTDGDVSANSNGWNLVGNPFASPVLWNEEEGAWARSGVSNVIAIRNDTLVDGRVRSQVTYYDLQLGGGVIPQGKAFWVRTYTASPSLSIQENAKVDPDSTALNPSQIKHMIVKLKQGGLADAAYIVFTEEGTEGLDPQLDGRKLPNHGMFNFSTITADTVSLAVNHLSSEFCSLSISLNVANVSPGSYAFSFENIQALTDIQGIVLTDHFTETSTPMTGADYVFSVTEDPNSFGRSRFSITFSKKQLDIAGPQLAGGEVCAPGPGYLTVSDSQEGAFYQVLDDAGKSISDLVEGNGDVIEIEILPDELTEGANIVTVTAGFSGCDRQPLPGTATLNYVTGLTVITETDISVCEGADITLEASGAPTGGVYRWFDSDGNLIDGASGPTLVVSDLLSEAVYYVATAHANGCQSSLAEIHIYTDSLDVPVIQSKEDTLFTDVVAYYQWKKDGEEISGAILNYYVPVETGKYSVVASSGGCFKESAPYQFGDPVTGIGNGNNNEFVLNIFPVPSPGDKISILLRSPKTEPVLIEIIDALGRLLYRQTIDAQTLMQGADLVPSSTLYNGIYFLRATQAEIRARKKIIVKN